MSYFICSNIGQRKPMQCEALTAFAVPCFEVL